MVRALLMNVVKHVYKNCGVCLSLSLLMAGVWMQLNLPWKPNIYNTLSMGEGLTKGSGKIYTYIIIIYYSTRPI